MLTPSIAPGTEEALGGHPLTVWGSGGTAPGHRHPESRAHVLCTAGGPKSPQPFLAST